MKLSTSLLPLFAMPALCTPLARRGLERCKNLEAGSNKGGRRIAILIDESGSMKDTDPHNVRIEAGRAVNDWLISSTEAGKGKEADLVSVIGFDDDPRTIYPLSDPSGADKVFSNISILGGTYIAGGVDAAIAELTKVPGPIANRSGIVVLTDGSDSFTNKLVKSIHNAGQQGIRVSFGFLDDGHSYSYKDPDILRAILGTGGMYSTINGDMAQNAFVNVIIVHGLTDNDNPSSKNFSAVYNGLSVAFILGSGGSSTLTYTAEPGESLTFTISSISAGDIEVAATNAGGKELGKTSVDSSSRSPEKLRVTTSSGGSLQLKVEGKPNLADAMFIVGVNSSIAPTNCTLAESKKGGLSKPEKIAIGISVPIAVWALYVGWTGLMMALKGAANSQIYGPKDSPMDSKQPYVHESVTTTTHPLQKLFKSSNQHQPSQNYNARAHPAQADPSHPTQADPSHPTESDPPHPTEADLSHPTQADSAHPTEADPAHPTQADPSHPTQPDPSHPTQADPHPDSDPYKSDFNPGDPPQEEPGQPHDPQDPHPKRLPTPRFPPTVPGRRRKDDKEDNQNEGGIGNQCEQQRPQQYYYNPHAGISGSYTKQTTLPAEMAGSSSYASHSTLHDHHGYSIRTDVDPNRSRHDVSPVEHHSTSTHPQKCVGLLPQVHEVSPQGTRSKSL